MRLEQLYAVVEIAHSGSMTAAAQKLHTSSQNMSKIIGQLEKEFNTILFTRSNQGVFLTPQGKIIYEYALEIIEKTDLLKQHIHTLPSSDSNIHGSLQLSCHTGQAAFMITILERLRFFYPNLRISLHSHLLPPTPKQFASGEYQVAFVSILKDELQSLSRYSKETNIYCFHEEALKVFMNKDSPYINQSTLSLKTLSELPFIDYSGTLDATSFSSQLFAQHGLSPNIIFSCNNPQLALEYISRNDAYCLGTNSGMHVHSIVNKFSIYIKPIKEKFIICYLALITKNKKQFNKEIQAFMNVFHEKFGSSYYLVSF